jgi:hypothetical protein
VRASVRARSVAMATVIAQSMSTGRVRVSFRVMFKVRLRLG